MDAKDSFLQKIHSRIFERREEEEEEEERGGKKGSRSREEKRNGYRLKASPVSFLLFFPASLTDARLILDSREFDTNKTTSPRSSIRRGGKKDPRERGRGREGRIYIVTSDKTIDRCTLGAFLAIHALNFSFPPSSPPSAKRRHE